MNSTALIIALAMAVAEPPVREDAVALADARRVLAANLASIRVGEKRLLDAVLTEDDLTQIAALATSVGTSAMYAEGVSETHFVLDNAVLVQRVEAILAKRKVRQEDIAVTVQALKSPEAGALLCVAGFSRPGDAGSSERAPLISVEDLLVDSARLDARRKLANEAAQIRLADGRRGFALFASRPDVEAALLGMIPAAALSAPRFGEKSDCTVEAAMEVSGMLEIMSRQLSIERSDDEEWGPRRLSPADDAPKRLTAIGQGSVPSRSTQRAIGVAFAWPEPAWARQCMMVDGTAAIQGGSPSFTQTVSSAEFDARCRIAERIDALVWTDGRTVRQVLGGGGVSPQDMETWLSSAHRVGTVRANGSERVSVTLQIPLRGLHRLLSQAVVARQERTP